MQNGPSPEWLQQRLRAIGLRPISALVDIPNFFTYDRNRPLHVFDADKVSGDLRVHRAKGGETLVGLDEKSYEFAPGMVVISDDQGVESIDLAWLTLLAAIELWARRVSEGQEHCCDQGS